MDGFPVPIAGIFDAPNVAVQINVMWRAFIVGQLENLLTPPRFGMDNNGVFVIPDNPTWAGDDDAQFDADQEIMKLISALARGISMIPVGTVMAYVGTSAPDGWLLCDGTSYLKADYPELWGVLSLSGTVYEDDSDDFLTPDLRGRVVVGAGTGATLTTRAIGEDGGAEGVQLTAANIPIHHEFNTAGFDPGEESVEIGYMSNNEGEAPPVAPFSPFSGRLNPDAANIMQPFHVLNYIIKT